MEKVDLAMEHLMQTYSDDRDIAFDGEQKLSILFETMTAEERDEYITTANSYAAFFGKDFSE
jgi:hypothetical protein